jgi:serine/threonine-protein kinase
MDAERWRAVRDLLDAALDLPADARPGFLAQIHDSSLRTEVERLLQRHAQHTAPIDKPAAAILQTELAGPRNWDQEQVGRRIGAFALVELLGAGGMGTVYRAERSDGAFEQVVAIKLVLSAHPGLRERFRREQEILAALRHPGIAQLIDGGETEDGIPYLVMEYIEGVPLTDHCRNAALEVRDRLKLIREVALALAHAHRNLIVHRDIKPTNILVDRHSGRPMLLDFGIAKLIGDEGPEMTAQRIGPMTPAYAAPEQFLGQPVSVATDVYQIGVLLYRLVAGTLPFAGNDALALSHAVLAAEVPTLERVHRAALKAAGQQLEAVPQLPRALSRELDALLRKAMARDPARRYGSMDALVADLDALLDQRPLQARQGARFYPLQQFARRHRVSLAIGVSAALALIATTGIAIHQARAAFAEAERARVAVDFLREVFRGADPNIGRSPNAGALELIDLAATELDLRLGAHSDLRGPVAALMASAYASFGSMERALPLARRAIDDLSATTSDGLTLAAAYESGAWIASRNGQRELAERWGGLAEALIGTAKDAESIRIRDGLFLLTWTMAREDGKLDEALAIAERAVVNARGAPPATRNVMLGRALQRRGTILTDLGQFARAEPDMIEAVTLTERSYGDEDYRTLRMRMALGWHYNSAGDTLRGMRIFKDIGPTLVRVYGERSQTVGNYHWNVANVDWAEGRLVAARDGYLKAARSYELSGAKNTSYGGGALWNVAKIEMQLGNLQRADALCDEVERRWQGVVPPDAPVRKLFAETRADLKAALAKQEADKPPPQ